MDHDIQQVLQNDQLTEDQKVQNYSQKLQNYLTYYNQRKEEPIKIQIDTPPERKKNENEETATTETEPQEIGNSLEDEILHSLPKSLKEKGKMLLEKIKQNPEIMKWDEGGQLIFEGEPLQGTHIVDLIGDSIRSRKASNPVGWETFTKGLAKMNASEHLVGNKQRRSALRNYKQGSAVKTFITPQESEPWFPTPETLPGNRGPIKSTSRNPRKQMRQRWLTFNS